MTVAPRGPQATRTDPAKLPQWKGHPVPWVTRWTGQVSPDAINVKLDADGHLFAGYEGPVQENREANGVLWIREGLSRSGFPEFSQLSTYRQRVSMTRRRCQVCGRRIEPGVIRWLLSRDQLLTSRAGDTITMSPPTCDGCVPLALELCPHLRIPGKAVVAKVLEYETWGVYGSVVGLDKQMKAIEKKGLVCYFDQDQYPFPFECVVARQLIVRFNKFVLED